MTLKADKSVARKSVRAIAKGSLTTCPGRLGLARHLRGPSRHRFQYVDFKTSCATPIPAQSSAETDLFLAVSITNVFATGPEYQPRPAAESRPPVAVITDTP